MERDELLASLRNNPTPEQIGEALALLLEQGVRHHELSQDGLYMVYQLVKNQFGDFQKRLLQGFLKKT